MELANVSAKEKNLQITFKQQDIHQIDTANSYDFIYCRFLLQHLKNPLAALQKLQKVLHVGGRICILDINDEWSFLHPPVPEFEELKIKAIHRQQELGGNRLIARELPILLKSAGFNKIKTDTLSIYSEQLGMEACLQLTQEFKVELFKDTSFLNEIETHLANIKYIVMSKDYFGMSSAFMISASR